MYSHIQPFVAICNIGTEPLNCLDCRQTFKCRRHVIRGDILDQVISRFTCICNREGTIKICCASRGRNGLNFMGCGCFPLLQSICNDIGTVSVRRVFP